MIRLWKNYASVSGHNLIIPGIFLISAWLLPLLSRRHQWLSWTIFTVTLLSGLYFANKYLFFSQRMFIYPQTPLVQELQKISGLDRIWGYGEAYFEPNIMSYYHLYSAEGYDGLFPKRYGELLSLIHNGGKLTVNISRSDATLKATSERDSLFNDPVRTRLFSLLGVKYIVETKKKVTVPPNFPSPLLKEKELKLVWENETWRLWEYKLAFPRAFFVTDYLLAKDGNAISNSLLDPKVDLGSTVILEEDPGIPSVDQPTQNSAKTVIKTYSPNEVMIENISSRAGLVFLSDNDYPGWEVKVDGKPRKLLRADYSFRAVVVPAGDHVVEFSYQPRSFRIGLTVSLSSLVVLVLIYAYAKKRNF